MIRHVIVWRLKAETVEQKAADAAGIESRLQSLRPLIPEILALEVQSNMAYPERNWDVVLIADYPDLAGLEAYQEHPAHQEVAAWIRSVVAERASVDVEV